MSKNFDGMWWSVGILVMGRCITRQVATFCMLSASRICALHLSWIPSISYVVRNYLRRIGRRVGRCLNRNERPKNQALWQRASYVNTDLRLFFLIPTSSMYLKRLRGRALPRSVKLRQLIQPYFSLNNMQTYCGLQQLSNIQRFLIIAIMIRGPRGFVYIKMWDATLLVGGEKYLGCESNRELRGTIRRCLSFAATTCLDLPNLKLFVRTMYFPFHG